MSAFNDEQLEQLLRGLAPRIEDDGFSERVVAQLPARRRWRKPIILGFAALGGLAGFTVLPGAASLMQAIHQLSQAIGVNHFIWLCSASALLLALFIASGQSRERGLLQS
jgi:hypothetical protein